MNKKNLPPPSFHWKYEDVCGNEVGPSTPFWNQAAVEQAVREALAAQGSAPVAGEAQLPWHLPVQHWTDEEKAKLLAAPQASEAVLTQVLAALESAQRFIRNGIEFGYIRMPDADTPDPAHRTPGLIDAAIRSLKSLADKDGGQWEPQTPEQIAADMRTMARSEGFDWPEPASGQQLRWRVTDDMRYAVRFAPSSAHWSERLKEFFGPDAREGIDALERQLREARAMLDRQQRAGDECKHARAHRAGDRQGYTCPDCGEFVSDYEIHRRQRAALSAPQAGQGERDAD